MIPLLGGDLVPDLDQGWSVISADQMASWIAPRVGASMMIYGTDVGGLYSSDPKLSGSAELIERIDYRSIRSAAKSALGSRMPDVTAGMRGKLQEAESAARRGVEVVIMNLTQPQNLHAILDGKRGTWTTIAPKRRRLE
jgi:glutamate 5-kinase